MLRFALLAGVSLSLLAAPAQASDPSAWHLPLAGLVPSHEPSAPAVQHHRFQATGPGSNVVVLATESKILAGVQPQDGSLLWRRSYASSEAPVTHLAAGEDTVLAWTTPSAADLHAVDVATGKLLWRADEGKDECEGKKADVFVEQRGEEGTEDAVVVHCGGLVRRLGKQNGRAEMFGKLHTVHDDQLATFNGRRVGIFSTDSKEVSLTTFDLSSDTTSTSISSRSSPAASDALAVSQSGSMGLVWAEKGSLAGVVTVGSGFDKLKHLEQPKLPVNVDRLLDVGLAQKGFFLALQEGGKTAVIVALTEEGKLVSCGTFSLSNEGPALASYADRSGGLHISYLDFSRVLGFASLQIWSQTSEDPHGLISAHSFPLTKDEFAGMRGYALQVLPLRPTETTIAPALSRVALVTSSGALQLWEGDNKKWTREEGLASAEVGPVDIRDALVKQGFLESPTDLPTYLFASSLTRTLYGVFPTLNESFSIDWAATVPASAVSNADGEFRWKSVSGLREGKDGEAVVEAIAVVGGQERGFFFDLASGKKVGKGEVKEVDKLSSAVPATYTIALETPNARTVVGRLASASLDVSPTWVFTLPPSQKILSVQAQVPPASLPGPTHHSASLVAVLSTSASSSSLTLSLLDAATGSLLHQLHEPLPAGVVDAAGAGVEEAVAPPQVMWDVSLPGWKVITAVATGKGETRVRVYKLKPGRTASAKLDVSAVELFLPGLLKPVGLSLTTLRLAAPCLLVRDRLSRLFAFPVRYLEALAVGRPPVPGLPWQLSATRELLPSSSTLLLTLGLPTFPSPPSLPRAHPLLRESESLLISLSGSDLFAAVFAPSRSFDQLGEAFGKAQLGVVLAVLGVAWAGTRSWAASHRTKQLWLE
ncbi:hypothetical protein JCM6882_004784 [Rhodosporidiobolus microsporus]